jgi:hypothetical protein
LVEYPLIHLQQRFERLVLLSHLEKQELSHRCKASPSSLLHKAREVSQSNLLYEAWGVSQSSRLYKTIEVNPFNS